MIGKPILSRFSRFAARFQRVQVGQRIDFLLADSVRLILEELHGLGVQAGECISLDTKHILAFVKENNPKAYLEDRYDKTKQPAGDADCKLGCRCTPPDYPCHSS